MCVEHKTKTPSTSGEFSAFSEIMSVLPIVASILIVYGFHGSCSNDCVLGSTAHSQGLF